MNTVGWIYAADVTVCSTRNIRSIACQSYGPNVM